MRWKNAIILIRLENNKIIRKQKMNESHEKTVIILRIWQTWMMPKSKRSLKMIMKWFCCDIYHIYFLENVAHCVPFLHIMHTVLDWKVIISNWDDEISLSWEYLQSSPYILRPLILCLSVSSSPGVPGEKGLEGEAGHTGKMGPVGDKGITKESHFNLILIYSLCLYMSF